MKSLTIALLVAGALAAPFKYEYQPNLLKLPRDDMLNGHGLLKDRDGSIYFTYQPKAVAGDTRVLVKFNGDGTNGQLLGSSNALAFGTPHGLRISHEAEGTFFYHANNEFMLYKTTATGELVWTFNATANFHGTRYWPCRPTDAVVPPGSQHVFLSDGYGSSWVHVLDRLTGKYTNFSFGGAGNTTSPQRFNCPHGINWDPARNALLVSDRGNNRLQVVTVEGVHITTIDMSPSSRLAPAGIQPCNVDFDPEGLALIPGLDGPVGIVDKTLTEIVTVIPVSTLLPKECPHPHDAIFLPNGDVVVCCWNPGHLSYWKKVPVTAAEAL